MNLHGSKAVLFDLDGVLVDSESAYTLFWDDIERHRYPTGIADYARAIKGTSLSLILSRYPSDAVRADIVERLHAFEAEMPYTPMPGARRLLERLRRASVATAIVTSSEDSKMDCLRRQLPWIEESVDVVVTGSMVSRSKPDPEGYLTAARALGVEPARCIVVEDSLQGLRAGRAAGSRVVGLSTTLPADMLAGEADEVHPTLAAWALTLEKAPISRQ